MTTDSKGGLPVCRLPALTPDEGVAGLRLISDLHIGSSSFEEGLLKADLEDARRRRQRILLGGDVFDLLLPSDRKRYTPARVHPRLHGRDDLVNAAVEWASELLVPYADLIDVIGTGNHESAALAHHSVDAVRSLCAALEVAGGNPFQAGNTAYLRYPLASVAGRVFRGGGYTIWYTHGAGRAKSAPEALRYLLSRTPSFRADLYWCGHFHSRASCCESVLDLAHDGRVVRKDLRCVVTGAYMDPYGTETRASIEKKGRRGNYASEGALTPHGMGGVQVLLAWDETGVITKTEVVQ